MPEQNITSAHADQVKAVERLRKLVSKREEMLAAARKEKERVDFKVSRREEILDEHIGLLNEAEDVLEALNGQIEAATS